MTKNQKRRQFEYQRGLCCWCLGPMILARGCKNSLVATKEHILPKSLGGKDNLANLVLACRKCNGTRGQDTTRIPHFRSYRLAIDVKAEVGSAPP